MSNFTKSVIFILIALLIFSLFRLILFFFHIREAPISSFINGLRFDFFQIATFWLIPLLVVNLPLILGETIYKIFFWLMYLILLVFIVVLAVDIGFFSISQKHISVEVLNLTWQDLIELLPIIFSVSNMKYLLLLLAFSVVLGYIWAKIIQIKSHFPDIRFRIATFLILLGTLIVGMRGTFSSKPLHIVDAFAGGVDYGNLSLNGVFTIYRTVYSFFKSHSGAKNLGIRTKFFPYEEAEKILGISGSIPFKKESKCLTKENSNEKEYNLIVLILESWTPKYIDSFSGERLGITPNFDRLASEGVIFSRFYSAGLRSIHGLQAILTGIPVLPGLPTVGFGLEALNFKGIGTILRKYQYKTIFVQSSKRNSYRLGSLAKASGFDYIWGKEDIQKEVGHLLNYPPGPPPPFGWDYETLIFLLNKIEEIGEKFAAFVFTGTTHPSFPELPKEFIKFPHSEYGLGGYLNTLFYSDWSLGEFMKIAREKEWFRRTIFILTADHPSFAPNNFLEMFHIPFVIYAPFIFSPKKITDTVGSQYDIYPTIIDLLCLEDEFSSIGKSLFRKTKNDFAFVSSGDMIGAISPDGFISHTTWQVSEATAPHLETNLLALFQMSYYAITKNKWFR